MISTDYIKADELYFYRKDYIRGYLTGRLHLVLPAGKHRFPHYEHEFEKFLEKWWDGGDRYVDPERPWCPPYCYKMFRGDARVSAGLFGGGFDESRDLEQEYLDLILERFIQIKTG